MMSVNDDLTKVKDIMELGVYEFLEGCEYLILKSRLKR